MPFEIMDQRGSTTSSYFFEDIRLPAERQIGFCKPHSVPDHQGPAGMVPIAGTKLTASSHSNTLSSAMTLSVDSVELPESILAGDRKGKLPTDERGANMLKDSCSSMDHHPKSRSSLSVQPASYGSGRSMAGYSKTQCESSLFSSSLSEVFNRKLGILENDVQSYQHTKIVASSHIEEEPFESLEEIEAQTIGNLLPAEDDLLSGVTDGLAHNSCTYGGDDLEDFDLFSSSGGLELEGEDHISVRKRNSDAIGRAGQGAFNGLLVAKHPYGEYPSKTILCRDMDSNADNSEPKALLEQHPTIRSPVGAFGEPHWSSSVPNNLPSPARVASVGKTFVPHEPNRSLDEVKFGNQCFPNFHPHSLPECHDGLANDILYKSSSATGGLASNAGSKVTEGINIRHIPGAGSSGHILELNGGVFGSSGNGSCTLPGHQYIWSNANSGQQHPSSCMMWPNSPSFVNGVHPHHLPHMPGFPRAPSVMLNTASTQHHVGSAPAVNPSLWDRSYGYSGESPEASSFHLGSLGNVNFPGSSPSHPMEIAPHTMFSHVRGNCMDIISKNAGLHAPQQIHHIFSGRNPTISNPASFDSSNERVRSLSHRRIESNANHSDKKQYELDIDHIIRGEDSRTTLMIKNIPNKYTSKMLLGAIDEHCRGTYDFLYLPIDFKNKCNVGYAFVNMIDPQQIIPFYKAFNGKKWEKFNSEKVASLAYARIQGKAALVAHFQNSSLMNEDKRCRPILFHTDGPNAGDPEPFPMGTNIRPRLGKHRTIGVEENHLHGSASTGANGENSSNGTDSSSSTD